MARRIVKLAALATLLGLLLCVYARFFYAPTLAEGPQFHDNKQPLPKTDEFLELAKTDPVAMYEKCLSRYQREVKGGFRATLVKRERVKGEPKLPEDPQEEVISLAVRGDVPDDAGGKECIEVVMKWRSGARESLGAEILGTFFSEKPSPEGTDKKVLVWRPGALVSAMKTPPNTTLAQGQSRYCIRDAGVYRGMLRTYTAWKQRKEADMLKTEYLGTRAVPEADGRICHIIRRTCNGLEVDPFELGGEADLSAGNVAKSGFTSVTVMIDAEYWLQVGSVLERTGPDGQSVLIASYYFRDIQLNPKFEPDTFSEAGLKKK